MPIIILLGAHKTNTQFQVVGPRLLVVIIELEVHVCTSALTPVSPVVIHRMIHVRHMEEVRVSVKRAVGVVVPPCPSQQPRVVRLAADVVVVVVVVVVVAVVVLIVAVTMGLPGVFVQCVLHVKGSAADPAVVPAHGQAQRPRGSEASTTQDAEQRR